MEGYEIEITEPSGEFPLIDLGRDIEVKGRIKGKIDRDLSLKVELFDREGRLLRYACQNRLKDTSIDLNYPGLVTYKEELDPKKTVFPRALRLTALYFVWSAIYLLGRFAAGQVSTADDLLDLLIQGYYHLWFLPAMVLCTLALPPVHSMLHGKKLDPVYPLLLILAYPVLYTTVGYCFSRESKLFQLTRVFNREFFLYVGYALWGAWLDAHPMPKKLRWIAPPVWLLVSALAAAVNIRSSMSKGYVDGVLFDYFSVSTFLQASAILCFFLTWKDRPSRPGKLLPALSDATLGVYLVHPMLIGIVEKTGLLPENMEPLLRLTLLFLILVALSFPLVMLAKKIPLVRKLM